MMASAAVASTTSSTSTATTVTVSSSARKSPGQASGSSGGGTISRDELVENLYDSTNIDGGKASKGCEDYEQSHQYSPEETSADSLNENRPDFKKDGRGGESPLPRELKRILEEVARIGTSSLLSWDQEMKQLSTGSVATGVTKESSSEAFASNPVGVALAASVARPTDSRTSPGFRGNNPAGTAGLSRQPFNSGGWRSSGPPRKKHRNGIHKGINSSRMRFGNPDGASNSVSTGRKRPLFSIRPTAPGTSGTITTHGVNSSAPSSVGSGRTSGSEPDDSTQYECDSEGTSATTNSEVSMERLRKSNVQVASNASGQVLQHRWTEFLKPSGGKDKHHEVLPYKTLQSAFRVALGLVLDHFYHYRGGYKLSPAEKLRNKILDDSDGGTGSGNELASRGGRGPMNDGNKKAIPLSSEAIFQQRRQRLMVMLLPASMNSDNNSRRLKLARSGDDPPFTIQRIAEVLVSPERYYTQTHKLCNCLEKLLLVTSSAGAFGGSAGGVTSQSRREEQELAALAAEKERQESRLRQKRFRRRTSSPTDELTEPVQGGKSSESAWLGNDGMTMQEGFLNIQPTEEVFYKTTSHTETVETHNESEATIRSPSDRQKLEAAARASLRSKFDHVGIDPHHLSNDRDVRTIAENRGMTNSPPPPSFPMSVAPSNVTLPGHSGVSGFVRQHLPEQNLESPSISRIPSPIRFSPGNDSQINSASNMHMLQLHHAASLAGATFNRTNTPPLDLMTIEGVTDPRVRPHSDSQELEAEPGRSSASNSDVDSESDDVSFDDSASDRSDGSDSGSATHYEPFTAARAMALNRMQQQQRLQSRVLAALGTPHQSEGYRPPADSEYQSGDSIDSTRAEDSGGSDSSSSDLAD